MREQKQQIYRFDNFRLDVSNRQLLRDGQPVALPAKAFDMLVVLVEKGGRLMGKDELFSRVWPDQTVEESNLTVQVSAIRKALGERKENPHYIATVPGHGYRFIGGLISVDEEKEEVMIEHHSVSRLIVETEEEIDSEVEALTIATTPVAAKEAITVGGWQTYEARPARRFALASFALPGEKRFHHSPFLLALAGGVDPDFGRGRFRSLALQLQNKKHARTGAPPFAQTTTRQLTTKGKIALALISPDGEFFAYTLAERGESKQSLWLGQIDGGNDIQLRPPEENFYNGMAFSSDSKTLYYSTAPQFTTPSTLYRIPILGSVPDRLLSRVGMFFSLSPDDRQIAFFRTDENTSALVIANLDGSGERVAMARPLDERFSSNAPAWSPDGSMLAVAALNEDKHVEVFILQLQDGSIKQLTGVSWHDIVNLVWQGDGQGLIAVAVESGAIFNQLWQIDHPRGDVRRLSRDVDSYGSSLSVSADSNLLLAVQERAESNIWVAPADNPAQARQVTFGSIGAAYGWHGLDWTIDGKILFTGAKDQSWVIFSANADGSNLNQLTSAGFVDEKLSATPDGRFIVFQSNRSGGTEIWRANSDGSDLQQLTTGGRNSRPHVAPNGEWVFYTSVRQNKSGIWRIPLRGGEPVRVTDQASAYPRVSPDGKVIACTYQAGNDNHWRIALVPVAGVAPTKLFELPRSANFLDGIRWTPDGRAFCYRNRGGGIWKQDIEGGAPHLLSLPEAQVRAYGWSQDGKHIAFSNGHGIRDAVLIRNRN